MFKYKKTQYENIFEWDKKNEGTCFYCKQDRPIEIELIGKKGICNDCLNDFEIGQVGADRHVIEHILPECSSYQEVVDWFKSKGVIMIEKDIINEMHIYDAVNDQKTYDGYMEQLRKNGLVPMNKEIMYSYTSVEIAEDGSRIHIVY